MNQSEAIEWMVEEKLAENAYSAFHIWNNLHLEGEDREKHQEKVCLYRGWRGFCKNTALCFALAYEGIQIPKSFIENERAETTKESGC